MTETAVKEVMTDKERKIMRTFGEVIPKLTEGEKDYLLGLGEGMRVSISKTATGQNTAPAAGPNNLLPCAKKGRIVQDMKDKIGFYRKQIRRLVMQIDNEKFLRRVYISLRDFLWET